MQKGDWVVGTDTEIPLFRDSTTGRSLDAEFPRAEVKACLYEEGLHNMASGLKASTSAASPPLRADTAERKFWNNLRGCGTHLLLACHSFFVQKNKRA